MVRLHCIRGQEVVMNADIIETVEATPDTVITLVDGRKIVVPDDIDEIRRFRARVLAEADELRHHKPADVVLLPGHDDG